MTVSPDQLRAAARPLPTGVTVVTSGQGPDAHGMTVNSFTTLSLTPPLVLFSVRTGARIHSRIERSGGFVVNLLAAEQAELARWFANSERPTGAAGFVGIAFHDKHSAEGPVLDGAVSFFACGLERFVDAGDQVIVIVSVRRCETLRSALALAFADGGFRELDPAPTS